MPIDPYDDESDDEPRAAASRRAPGDFECPSCSANNPLDAPLTDRAEVLCHYCGSQFLARVSDEGRVRFKEL